MWFGKPRSKFGKFVDQHGVSQKWLAEKIGVSEATISELASGKRKAPTMSTASKIIKALRKFDSEISSEDFWG